MKTFLKDKVWVFLKNKDWTIFIASGLIIFGCLVILFLPYVLTNFQFFRINFTQTGQIGDTIGGITAPFLALINATLMFLTIRAQIKANKIIQDQIISDNDSKKINVLFDFLQKSLDTLGIRELENSGMPLTNNVVSSIAYIFSEAGKNQGENTRLKIKAIKIQLLDALTLIDRLFELLKVSKDNNKDIMLFILKHIFNSKFKLLASESNVGLFGEELITISNRLNSTLGSL